MDNLKPLEPHMARGSYLDILAIFVDQSSSTHFVGVTNILLTQGANKPSCPINVKSPIGRTVKLKP